MGRSKFIHLIRKQCCFGCKDSSPGPFPCQNHNLFAVAAGRRCTCGLDTLRDGSLDFQAIAENIQMLCNPQQSQVETSGNEIQVLVDPRQEEDSGQIRIGNACVFSYNELREATNNFHPSRKLGGGGYGKVYLGKLKDGKMVAVKILFDDNPKRLSQFVNEFLILSSIRHPNLVSFFGCTSPGGQELLLVYDYVPNGTVADHLYGQRAVSRTLTWDLRIRIAIETAEVLSYLHSIEGRIGIVHSDVKTDNILLDNTFHVKVADFGLCNPFRSDFNPVLLPTTPGGTLGYLDPEYDQNGKLTDKSDVYSLGVVLLELISGMKAVDVERDEIYLFRLALNKIQNKELDQLVDSKLDYHSDPVIRKMIQSMAELATRCLELEAGMRPPMVEVLFILKRIRDESQGRNEQDRELEEDRPGLLKNLLQSLPNEEGSSDNYYLTWINKITSYTSFTRLFYHDRGIIDLVEMVRRLNGHNVSSIILFYMFKVHNPDGSQIHYSSESQSCQCRNYLQNNQILEGVAQSQCFSRLIFMYIISLAVFQGTPANVVLRNLTILDP